jgi:hypothetical protein
MVLLAAFDINTQCLSWILSISILFAQCPFSAKQYKTLREAVYPAFKEKSFSITMYHQVQPWHPQVRVPKSSFLTFNPSYRRLGV